MMDKRGSDGGAYTSAITMTIEDFIGAQPQTRRIPSSDMQPGEKPSEWIARMCDIQETNKSN